MGNEVKKSACVNACGALKKKKRFSKILTPHHNTLTTNSNYSQTEHVLTRDLAHMDTRTYTYTNIDMHTKKHTQPKEHHSQQYASVWVLSAQRKRGGPTFFSAAGRTHG